MNAVNKEKINVGVNIPASELAEMRQITCVDLSGPAVLALARKGLAVEKAKAKESLNKMSLNKRN